MVPDISKSSTELVVIVEGAEAVVIVGVAASKTEELSTTTPA